MVKSGQHVARSNSRLRVPYDHAKYGIYGVLLPRGTPVGFCRHVDTYHRRPSVESATAFLRCSFHLDTVGGQVNGHRPGGVVGVDSRQLHPPLGGLQSVGQSGSTGLDHLDDVDTLRHGRVEAGSHLLRRTPLGQEEFKVLGFARGPCGYRSGVRNLGMR